MGQVIIILKTVLVKTGERNVGIYGFIRVSFRYKNKIELILYSSPPIIILCYTCDGSVRGHLSDISPCFPKKQHSFFILM